MSAAKDFLGPALGEEDAIEIAKRIMDDPEYIKEFLSKSKAKSVELKILLISLKDSGKKTLEKFLRAWANGKQRAEELKDMSKIDANVTGKITLKIQQTTYNLDII